MILSKNHKIILVVIALGLVIFFGLLARSVVQGFQRLMDSEKYNSRDPISMNSAIEKPVHALCVLVSSL